MRQLRALPKALLLLGALGVACATAAPPSAQAQDYVCPDGYYYVEGYGCAPLSYYYGPDIVPDLGFGFFYGGRWGGGYRGNGFHGGGFHGGFHGGGFHGGGGGGFHGGGGGHGGGGHR
jgi:hypothetical protein